MEPNRKNSILQCLGDNNENISSNILREMFIKSEINSQASDDDDDYITLENFKLKVEKTNNETVPSIEEAISNLKTEVEFIVESSESSKIDPYRNLENEIERKRKLSASELTDYLYSTMSKRNKAKIHESTVTETKEKNLKNPAHTLVYTTRLDEMRVFRNNLRKLDRLIIWEEILRESKPLYNCLQHTTKLTKRPCKRKKLRKLYNDIKIINDTKSTKQSEQTIHNEEITCESRKKCSQPNIISNNKSDHKVFDNTDLCQIKDEVIDFKDTLNERNNRNTSLTDTISNNSQQLVKNPVNNYPMLSKILQTNIVIKTENIYKPETVMKVAKLLLESKLESNETLPGRRKSDVQDPAIVAPDALLRNMLCSVVYTTRLNDMLVLRKRLKFLDGKYVLREILRESKPNIKHLTRKTNAKSVNRISFKQLQIKLQSLNNKNKNKCIETFNAEKEDNCDLVPTDLFEIKNQSDYARILLDPKICNEIDAEGYANTSNSKSNLCVYNPHVQIIEKIEVKRNIALIIYNNISKLKEIYITDNGGNVTECRKSINCNPLVRIIDFTKQIDPTKQIIKFTTCCWFHRKMNIDKIWSNTNTGIARFVQSKHECLPGNCKCCCKPKLVSNSFKIFVDVNNEVETKYVKDLKVNNLIARALDYRRPKKEKRRDLLPTLDQPIVVQINKCQGEKNGKEIEYYAIDSKGFLEWQIKLYKNDYNLNNAINHLKRPMTGVREVMCNREEKNQFICLLKESNIPFNVIKYLKGKKGLGKSNETHITPCIPTVRLIMETPHIEHTRKCTLATLIKIKDIINYTTTVKKRKTLHENKNDRSRQSLNPEPSTSGMCLLKTNLPSNKTIPDIVLKDSQKLIITCEEFPEIETIITNVDPTIAAALLDEFKHISFVAKTGKLIATMLSTMQNGNPEGFKILAKIIHLTQTKMKHLMISSEMKIHLHIRSESMKRENIGVTKKCIKEETILDNVEETTKYSIFTNFITYDKKLHKKSFESYIKHESKKGAITDNVVMPIISNVFSLNDNKSTNLNNETTKNDFIDSFASTSFNYDVRNETSQLAMPIHGNYLQINSQQSQILHLSSNTIVENTISTILNKSNPPAVVGQSLTGLQHTDVQIPLNFIIDKSIVCDLINSLPNNTVNKSENNLILKSLLNKKS